MYPFLFQYGPLIIHNFSVMLGIGIIVFMYLASKEIDNRKLMPRNLFLDEVTHVIIWGIVGARLLHVISEPAAYKNILNIFFIWNGGLSVFGSMLGVAGYAYFKLKNNPDGWQILDVACLYVPLIHAFARIGCFLAGCCYGHATSFFTGIVYHHTGCAAPLDIALHPTQLYSSALFFMIFFLLKYLDQKSFLQPGQLAFLYLFCSSLERFTIDFLRGDRIMQGGILSFHQYIALALVGIALVGFVALSLRRMKITA